MVPSTRYSSFSMASLGTASPGFTCRPRIARAESCRGLISGHPNTASRIGKHRLKAGKGRVLRPEVADAMACTAAATAGCSGMGTRSALSPTECRHKVTRAQNACLSKMVS